LEPKLAAREAGAAVPPLAAAVHDGQRRAARFPAVQQAACQYQVDAAWRELCQE
jgi:hypothetical protein